MGLDNKRTVKRLRRAALILTILTLVFQPSLAWSSGGSRSGSGGGCSGGGGSYGSRDNYIATEVDADYNSDDILVTPITYTETLNGEDYISKLLGDGGSRFDPRLPGYSYFQGVIQAENHVTIAGQVRVVGAVMGADETDATLNFYGGAMVTTNAHGILGAGDALIGGPAGIPTRIKSMEEVPNP